jgi:hypothetical protein
MAFLRTGSERRLVGLGSPPEKRRIAGAVALPTARYARIERGNRLGPTQHAQLSRDCCRRSSSCCSPKPVPLFNESGEFVPTSRTWGHRHHESPALAGLLLSLSAAGQGDFIFAYTPVAQMLSELLCVCLGCGKVWQPENLITPQKSCSKCGTALYRGRVTLPRPGHPFAARLRKRVPNTTKEADPAREEHEQHDASHSQTRDSVVDRTDPPPNPPQPSPQLPFRLLRSAAHPRFWLRMHCPQRIRKLRPTLPPSVTHHVSARGRGREIARSIRIDCLLRFGPAAHRGVTFGPNGEHRVGVSHVRTLAEANLSFLKTLPLARCSPR